MPSISTTPPCQKLQGGQATDDPALEKVNGAATRSDAVPPSLYPTRNINTSISDRFVYASPQNCTIQIQYTNNNKKINRSMHAMDHHNPFSPPR
ncbi:hypothetical protein VTJ04DRAFT_4020 [Mycothermus thermophilus]|uniref:uncharacterized protein n=1 Tax=Humicola insolens TaxID=85995 RepID=UPI0037446708